MEENIKYLGINLMQRVQDLLAENKTKQKICREKQKEI